MDSDEPVWIRVTAAKFPPHCWPGDYPAFAGHPGPLVPLDRVEVESLVHQFRSIFHVALNNARERSTLHREARLSAVAALLARRHQADEVESFLESIFDSASGSESEPESQLDVTLLVAAPAAPPRPLALHAEASI